MSTAGDLMRVWEQGVYGDCHFLVSFAVNLIYFLNLLIFLKVWNVEEIGGKF